MQNKFHSLGLRSDAFVMTGLSIVEDHGPLLVMRTPHEPEYWYGNIIAYKAPPSDPLAEVEAFSKYFPDASHVQVMWDVPGLPIEPLRAALVPHGYAVESVDVLALPGNIRRVPVPEGIVLRAVESDADWDALFDLQVIGAVEDGHTAAAFAPYARARNAARRQQIASGLGQWFGAFDGDKIVAHMGMFVHDGVARYQTVETLASYRKRGISSALLVHAYDWAMGRDPQATAVIVADADSDGGRLYRKMGFAVAEVLVEAYRHPKS